MVLFVLLALIVVAVVGILVPVRLRFMLRVDSFRPTFSAEAAFFYRLLRLRIHGFLACAAFGETKLWLAVNGKPYKKIEPKPNEQKPKEKKGGAADAIVRSILKKRAFEMLRVRCRIGIEEDAYHTVLLCGALRILFNEFFRIFLHVENGEVSVAPDFSSSVFWLKVEGILTIRSTQIITAALGQRKKHKEGNIENVASD